MRVCVSQTVQVSNAGVLWRLLSLACFVSPRLQRSMRSWCPPESVSGHLVPGPPPTHPNCLLPRHGAGPGPRHPVHSHRRQRDLLPGDEQDRGADAGLPQVHRRSHQVSMARGWGGPQRTRANACPGPLFCAQGLVGTSDSQGPGVRCSPHICSLPREETEIIEGEVVEIQIDRPATGTVSRRPVWATSRPGGRGVKCVLRSESHGMSEPQMGAPACLQ